MNTNSTDTKMKTDLSNVLNETLKSERDVNAAEKVELKVPALEKADRIANAKWERESKFKKLTDDKYFFLDPNEGFFFNYNPSENYYFESNASFTFIVEQGVREKGEHYYKKRAPYNFLRITHPKLGHSELNFRVLKRTKQIYMEKTWDENRIKSNKMTDPIAFIDAFKVALRFHPELEDYTFVDQKMKVKDFVKSGPEALEAGEEHTVFMTVKAQEAEKILKTGKIEGEVTFDKKVAQEVAKWLRFFGDLYGVWAILEIKVKGTEGFGKQTYTSFEFKKDVDPKDIKLVRSNYLKYFKIRPPDLIDLDKYKNLSERSLTLNFAFVARDEEEFKYFIEVRRDKEHHTKKGIRGGRTLQGWSEAPWAKKVRLRESGGNLLIFAPGTTKEQVDKFFSFIWLQDSNLWYLIPWEKHETILDLGYDIVFKKKLPDFLEHEVIEKCFASENDLKRMGRTFPLPEIKNET